MPRRPRITLPNIPHHIIQRGNNRHSCFYADQDYQVYKNWLNDYARETGCSVHAYVLMTNHVHLLITPSEETSLGLLMKKLGQRYVQYINRTYRRSGTLWEGRFKSCITSEEDYILACYRYIELNPVRAQMAEHPAEYQWSSYRRNGQGDEDLLISQHPVYKALAKDPSERLLRYRELFRYQLESGMIDDIRSATNGNYALGSHRFQQQIEQTLGRRVAPGKSGRPARKE